MRRIILGVATAGGIIAAVGGLGLGGLILLMAAFGGAGGLPTGALAFGIIAVSLGLGLALAWSGWRGLAGAPGRLFSLPGWGWWLLAFAATLAAGYALFSAGLTPLMAPVHVAASATAAALALALVAGSARAGGGAASARVTVGSLAWGGLAAAAIAIVVEALLALAALLVLSIWLAAARPDLLEQLRTWALVLQSGQPSDPGELLPLLRSPWAVLAVLGFASVLVPLTEEAAKALAAPLVALTGRRLHRADAYLLGAAAGAGFALVEGVLNGALGLASPETWAGAMLMRGAATTLHCAAAALGGLGWQAVIFERDWVRGLLCGLLAVLLHGAWNAVAVGIAVRTLMDGGSAAMYAGYLGGLWLVAVLSLAFLPRWLARLDAR